MPIDPDNDGDNDTADTDADDRPTGWAFGYGFPVHPRPLYSVGEHRHKIAKVSGKARTRSTNSGTTGDIGARMGGPRRRR